MVSSLKDDLNDSINYTEVIKTPKIQKVPFSPGNYMTTCMTCSTTCHKYCCIADDGDKRGCACISGDYCVNCKNKCHWTQHKNLPYYFEEYMCEETVTLVELKKKYCESKSNLDVKTQLLMGTKKNLNDLITECINTQDLINKSINRLKEIALNKTSFESSEENIELLIEAEKSDKNEGWQTRIEQLKILKQIKY